MRKHRNIKQDEIFLSFMSTHQSLANGFFKGDRVEQEHLWSKLGDDLNAAGPPIKDVPTWKKVWTDWKGNVKKKLAHNKNEISSTGGGKFNQYLLTAADQEVATLCSLHTAVNGLPKSKNFGFSKIQKSVEVILSPDLPFNLLTTSEISPQSAPSPQPKSSRQSAPPTQPKPSPQSAPPTQPKPSPQSAPPTQPKPSLPLPQPTLSPSPQPTLSPSPPPSKKTKREYRLGELMEKENQQLKEIGLQLAAMTNSKNVLAEATQNMLFKLENIDKNYSEIVSIKKQKLDEIKRHNKQVEIHYQQIQNQNLQMAELKAKQFELQLKTTELKQQKFGVKDTLQQ